MSVATFTLCPCARAFFMLWTVRFRWQMQLILGGLKEPVVYLKHDSSVHVIRRRDKKTASYCFINVCWQRDSTIWSIYVFAPTGLHTA